METTILSSIPMSAINFFLGASQFPWEVLLQACCWAVFLRAGIEGSLLLKAKSCKWGCTRSSSTAAKTWRHSQPSQMVQGSSWKSGFLHPLQTLHCKSVHALSGITAANNWPVFTQKKGCAISPQGASTDLWEQTCWQTHVQISSEFSQSCFSFNNALKEAVYKWNPTAVAETPSPHFQDYQGCPWSQAMGLNMMGQIRSQAPVWKRISQQFSTSTAGPGCWGPALHTKGTGTEDPLILAIQTMPAKASTA